MRIEINFKCDEPTVNGHVYPKELMKKAVDDFNKKKLKPVLSSYSDFYKGNIDISKLLAEVDTIYISDDGRFVVDIIPLPKYKGIFDSGIKLTTMGVGNMDDNNIIIEFNLTGLFIDFDSMNVQNQKELF